MRTTKEKMNELVNMQSELLVKEDLNTNLYEFLIIGNAGHVFQSDITESLVKQITRTVFRESLRDGYTEKELAENREDITQLAHMRMWQYVDSYRKGIKATILYTHAHTIKATSEIGFFDENTKKEFSKETVPTLALYIELKKQARQAVRAVLGKRSATKDLNKFKDMQSDMSLNTLQSEQDALALEHNLITEIETKACATGKEALEFMKEMRTALTKGQYAVIVKALEQRGGDVLENGERQQLFKARQSLLEKPFFQNMLADDKLEYLEYLHKISYEDKELFNAIKAL